MPLIAMAGSDALVFFYSGSWDGSLLGWALYISRSKCYAEFLRR